MKLELYEIVKVFESFNEILKNNNVPFMLAWQIEDIQEPLRKHVKRFNDEKNKIVKEYGKPDEKNPEVFMVVPEKVAVFNEKMDLVGKIPIDIKTNGKIKKKDLFDSEIKISGKVNLKSIKIFIIEK